MPIQHLLKLKKNGFKLIQYGLTQTSITSLCDYMILKDFGESVFSYETNILTRDLSVISQEDNYAIIIRFSIKGWYSYEITYFLGT